MKANVKKSARSAMLWVAAIAFGLLGVMGTRGYIEQSLHDERARLAEQGRMRPVVVAKRGLPAGTMIAAELMAVRQLPVRYVSEAAVPAEHFDDVDGLRLVVPLASGDALLRTALAPNDAALSGRVRHGIRAMTVMVDDVNSVSGMLRPGDRIDLLFSTRSPLLTERGQSDIATPLMQDLVVLATGTNTRSGAVPADQDQTFSSITVEVTPRQAQKLVLAQDSGRLTALLRNPDDRRAMSSKAMDIYTLLGVSPPSKQVSRTGPELIIGGRGPIATAISPAIPAQPFGEKR